jgi:farnesyl diphosphate synthase
MAGAIERRREVWQQQHDQQNQEQAADDAQIRGFWLKAKEGAGGRIAGNDTDISLIIPAFSSGFKARHGLPTGIDEAPAINDCPGQLDWEQLLMTTGTVHFDFTKRLDQTAEDTEALLGRLLSDALLPDEIARPKRLMEAMRYSSLGGGKRLRPFLVVESSAVFGVPREAALLAGAALECIHCYSLIHDDLPAMDNSDLRRGRPTLHKKTDDATAILAGDGLLTLAFDIVTRDEIHRDPTVRLLLTRALARASGIGGMVGGQMLDLAGEGRFGDREPVDVARLQQMKTGALLRFGCIAGAILGQSSQKEYQALDDYGRALGEAFQIADDLLDVEGDAAALGKQTGQDAALGKTTFVTQLGIAGAKQRVRDLLGRADAALSIFGAKGEVLRAAARFVAERKN